MSKTNTFLEFTSGPSKCHTSIISQLEIQNISDLSQQPSSAKFSIFTAFSFPKWRKSCHGLEFARQVTSIAAMRDIKAVVS
jgi:hypothetical protein